MPSGVREVVDALRQGMQAAILPAPSGAEVARGIRRVAEVMWRSSRGTSPVQRRRENKRRLFAVTPADVKQTI
jgi:hypothetical protein